MSQVKRNLPDNAIELPGDTSEGGVRGIVNSIFWKLLLVICTLIYGMYSILMHLSEVDGKLPFSTGSVVLLTELLKLFASLVFFAPEVLAKTARYPPSLLSCTWFALPAILYSLNNNLAMFMQLEMDPATYQVLGNLKILTTAVLYKLIIQKEITHRKWFALFLLTVAGVANSYGGLSSNSHSHGTLHISVKGLFMIFCYCTISGLAGVVTEYILKKQPELSLHLQNGLLYSFGVVLNFAVFINQTGGIFSSEGRDLLHGYSVYTWLVICSQAFVGITVGAVMKHSNNIARLFIISCAMVVTTVLSMVIFNLQLNLFFVMAFILVSSALYIYHT